MSLFGRGAAVGSRRWRRIPAVAGIVCLLGAFAAACDSQTPHQPIAVAAGSNQPFPAAPNDVAHAPTVVRPTTPSVAELAARGSFGVPKGLSLTVHKGNLVITRPGTVIDRMDIYGTIRVKADNVTIMRSIVRGGPAATRTDALIAAWWGAKNLQVLDTTLRAQNRSLHIDGLAGGNFTARRLDVSDVVDTVKVIGPNATLLDSYLHDHFYSSNDLNQPDGHTHDDGVQIEGGTNILIRGNLIVGAHNAAIMITQNLAATSMVRIDSNWLEDGACTINVTQLGRGTRIVGLSITRNHFGAGSYGDTCPMRLPTTSKVAIAGNSWMTSSSEPVRPNWF